MDAIVVDKLRKQFDPPKGPVAVDGVSFAIREGEIFSLLGPNGAGKTTTISILSCLLKPDSGEADVGGFSVFRKPDEVKKLIGVVPQDIALYDDLSGRENLMFWGRMYGLSGSMLSKRVDEVLELIGLTDRQKDQRLLHVEGIVERVIVTPYERIPPDPVFPRRHPAGVPLERLPVNLSRFFRKTKREQLA